MLISVFKCFTGFKIYNNGGKGKSSTSDGLISDTFYTVKA